MILEEKMVMTNYTSFNMVLLKVASSKKSWWQP